MQPACNDTIVWLITNHSGKSRSRNDQRVVDATRVVEPHGAPLVCLVPTRHHLKPVKRAVTVVGAGVSTYSMGVQEPDPVQLVSVVQVTGL